MKRLSLVAVALLLQLAAGCGDGGNQTPTAPVEPTTPSSPGTGQSVQSLGDCRVGLIVLPNQSCRADVGTFAVQASGQACINNSICSGGSLQINAFRASRIGGTNNWMIDALTGSAPTNRAPTASGTIPDQNMEEGTQVMLDVSGAFSDPDGDALSYEAASNRSDVAAVSASGSDLTVTGEAPGSATITVTATDPGGLSATQTFRAVVMSANRAPTVSSTIADQSVEEGAQATIDAAAAFSDPDGDDLSYEAASDRPDVAAVSVSGSDVTVTGVAQGSATITVTATDPGGLEATQSFETVVGSDNRAPTVSSAIADQSVEEGAEVTIDVAAAFSDPDGDDLSYEAASDRPSVATVSVSGSDVTVTGVAPGSATITVTATDSGGLSATQAFGVTVEPADGGGQALTGEITTCTGRQLVPGGDLFTVIIEGTLTAHRSLQFIRLEGRANGAFVGFRLIGSMSPGESRSFNITGVVRLTGTSLVCDIDIDFQILTSHAQQGAGQGANPPDSLGLSRAGMTVP